MLGIRELVSGSEKCSPFVVRTRGLHDGRFKARGSNNQVTLEDMGRAAHESEGHLPSIVACARRKKRKRRDVFAVTR
ncbi:c2 domain-containing [Moniliophthora roreri]|nr:c2 domain-containing [Moniliophthora roreri]